MLPYHRSVRTSRTWSVCLCVTAVFWFTGCSGGPPDGSDLEQARKEGKIVVLWRESGGQVQLHGRGDGQFRVRYIRVNEPKDKKYWIVVRVEAPLMNRAGRVTTTYSSDARKIKTEDKGELICQWNANQGGVTYAGEGTLRVMVLED